MIYDCFWINKELDLLELRFSETADLVDKFVIVEADHTFINTKKPFYFEECLKTGRYDRWKDKIIHIPITYRGGNLLEETRMSWFSGLQGCSSDDIIMLSDIDEIADRNTLPIALSVSRIEPIVLQQSYRWFYMDREPIDFPFWSGAVIGTYEYMMGKNLHEVVQRRDSDFKKIPCGWHFNLWSGFFFDDTPASDFINGSGSNYDWFYNHCGDTWNDHPSRLFMRDMILPMTIQSDSLPETVKTNYYWSKFKSPQS